MIHTSELILNEDGSIYHLKLKPDQLANRVILVGDPGRVEVISSKFDDIECKVRNREFVTHTGTFKGKRVSAIATGIGADNIDIVLNELDALVNIDLENRVPKSTFNSLDMVRIGTCGSIQENVKADEVVVSSHAIGLDGLLNFYSFKMTSNETELFDQFIKQTNWSDELNRPYLVEGNKSLIEKIGKGFHKGITITANGFYAPQGRAIRLSPKYPEINDQLRKFNFGPQYIINYEMETSALYGLSRLLGHQACTVCVVVANRYANSFSKDYKPIISSLIDKVLERLTS